MGNLSVEWSRFGIRVNSVGPGPIQTPLLASGHPTYLQEFKKRIPLGRFGYPAEVARPLAFLASDMSAYITGQTIYIDGGYLSTSFNEAPGFWEDADQDDAAPAKRQRA